MLPAGFAKSSAATGSMVALLFQHVVVFVRNAKNEAGNSRIACACFVAISPSGKMVSWPYATCGQSMNEKEAFAMGIPIQISCWQCIAMFHEGSQRDFDLPKLFSNFLIDNQVNFTSCDHVQNAENDVDSCIGRSPQIPRNLIPPLVTHWRKEAFLF
ncbi:MAG: hypothetical protein A2849_02180 [Candidatus Taylorbacteria bacterium RIFCSPHIGHO2_01_FULL_51_15]|uniref:Uncharacterized protein n=1 Tax=Candidatus Taylorbacteria bacterium RIFCSPHIGHO2_01_FULL_51_15 TaxID=1802304 RepID=A0A1G2MCR5_9BACT|nr:MAG: hypothetical protein A2849_02180 [Candidatus Taylorbacteria bacterium RIFCSPHIGHO2_01_FULL_51_15]